MSVASSTMMRATIWFCTLVWLVSEPTVASANPAAYFDVRVAAPEIPIPRNGAILLQGPEVESAYLTVLRLSSEPVQPLEGAVRIVAEGYAVWTPSTPFEPGEYVVTVVAGIHAGSVITVIDELLEGVVPLVAAPVAAWSAVPQEHVQCQTWNGDHYRADEPIPVAVTGEIVVKPTLSTTASAASAHQFLYRAVSSEGDAGAWSTIDRVSVGPY